MAARRMVPVALLLLFLLSLSSAFHSSSVVRIRRASVAAVRCRSVPQDSSWKATRNYFVVGRFGRRDSGNNDKKKRAVVALWKQRTVATMATAVLIWMAPRPARADHPFLNSPASEKVGPRVSARPGATLDMLQQERQRRGSAPTFEALETDTGVATMDSSGTDRQHSNDNSNDNNNQKRRLFRKNRKRRATRHDDLHLLDDDDDDSGDNDIKEDPVAAMRESMATTTTSTHSRGVPEEKVSTRKVSKLSGRHTNLTPQQRNRKQTQVFLSIFGPIALVCFVRETVRWNWEQRDVKRGIAVVEAQRMEYYNTTQTDNTDDDNDEDDDEDDEDDDEEGDDEEEEEEKKRPRGGPRKPTPSGGNNNDGGGEGPDKPSAEDLDRLNRLFGKS